MLLLPALSSVASAQSVGAISGTVKDSAGAPIGGVEVVVLATHVHLRTDSLGAFRFANVPVGEHELSFRRFGFEPHTLSTKVLVDATAIVAVVLDPYAYLIDGMTVEESNRKHRQLGDFYERLSRGFGHFITRDQIEQRNPANLSDMMRMIPGARLVPTRVGGTSALRFSRATMGPGRDCPPQFWVDGVKAYQLNVDDIPPQDIEGVEIYAGPSGVPPQFNTKEGTTVCGVVLIWTRIPG